tara:strand:+ start:506 stop:709 length:204 start_codon:yes stop_codon:yes gene_type:complete
MKAVYTNNNGVKTCIIEKELKLKIISTLRLSNNIDGYFSSLFVIKKTIERHNIAKIRIKSLNKDGIP